MHVVYLKYRDTFSKTLFNDQNIAKSIRKQITNFIDFNIRKLIIITGVWAIVYINIVKMN